MLSSYFKIAYRNLIRSRSYAVINILGLAIGLAAFILMFAYVKHELSYDQFHSKSERLFRVNWQYEARGASTEVAMSAFPLKYMFLEDYPEVEQVVRFYKNNQDATTLKYEENHFTEENVLFADPEVFKVFDFPLAQGDPSTALAKMNSIVLTKRVAKKYFGEENPMGKIIQFKNDDLLKVTGVLEDVPANSHLTFDILVPTELQRQRWIRGDGNGGYDFEEDWKWSGTWQYVLLKNKDAYTTFNQKLYENGKDYFGRLPNAVVEYHYSAMPITDIHLQSSMSGELKVNGNLRQVNGFGVIAVLILIIACINFVNLSTARSAKRAKEVGLRKVMGALRYHLISQFIAESVLIAVIAMLLGAFLVEGMLPVFNRFMDQSLSIPYAQPAVILSMFVGAIIIGLIAGIYPALSLSRFQPVKTLKGNTTTGTRGNSRTRQVLVASQFIISNLLIVGILIVQGQLDYIKDKDLGFEKEQVIVLKHGNKLDEDFGLFTERIKASPFVRSANQGYVAGTRDWTQSFRVEGEALEEAKSIGIKHVGFDFLEMFDMKLVEGRFFKKEMYKDRREAILLNETAVKTFGWTNQEAINKTFSYVGGSDNRTQFECKVIGIFADAHLESLYRPIRPSVFKFAQWGDVSIRLEASNIDDLRAGISDIESIWNELSPQWPFEFDFLDDTIAKQYQQEERLGQTIQYFTILAIFIACLGLFGLASFTVQERTKEIGVRKVLGASISSILLLVSSRFFKLVAISFMISVPLAFYFGNTWLSEFEYRIEIGPMVFVLGALLSIGIAAIAVGGQSLRAASLNPVKTLRHE
ncbi:ABC transporter permease [Roseivirga sp. E12]|uniref:ABC transporter permease n=1 Tax=Roseivirga sp. E12 TaxID=2819237 RepID=UPI001ABD13A6|nr:ABC transporter permease [Roseivirga sp. E12]MBO3700743.1 ABC transporter permease [Roseivirga sp. E12]